jgi:hypothetical protein
MEIEAKIKELEKRNREAELGGGQKRRNWKKETVRQSWEVAKNALTSSMPKVR